MGLPEMGGGCAEELGGMEGRETIGREMEASGSSLGKCRRDPGGPCKQMEILS